MSNFSESQKMLRGASAEYGKIADALRSLMRGEVSAEEVTRISYESLNNVDKLIAEYAGKTKGV